MPDSMYDRLGDMLSDALESGIFFTEKKSSDSAGKNTSDTNAEKTSDTIEHVSEGRVEKSSEHEEKSAQGATEKVIHAPKKLPVSVKSAFKVLGLEENATAEAAKKAYHEKLKYYHPDRHGDNPVLQKVARDKTRQVLEAWQILDDFFSNDAS